MGRKQAVTYQDIAEYTGFSKATISRYFNDRDSLTLEKQDTISEALKKLDYRQNKVARVLANGKTEMVGILLPDLYHHFYYQILNKILGTYREFGFKFLVFNGDHNEEVERRYLQELMAYKVEGMIVLSNTLSSEELAGTGIPIVAIEREDRSIHSITTTILAGRWPPNFSGNGAVRSSFTSIRRSPRDIYFLPGTGFPDLWIIVKKTLFLIRNTISATDRIRRAFSSRSERSWKRLRPAAAERKRGSSREMIPMQTPS